MSHALRITSLICAFVTFFALGSELPIRAQAVCSPPYIYQPACRHPTLNVRKNPNDHDGFSIRAFDADIAVDLDLGSTITKYAFKEIHQPVWGGNFTAAVQEWNAINGHFSIFESSSCASAKQHSGSPICARMFFWSDYVKAGHPPETTAATVQPTKGTCPSGSPSPPPDMACTLASRIIINGGIRWETVGGDGTGKIDVDLNKLLPREGSQEAKGQSFLRGRAGTPRTFQRAIKGDMLHGKRSRPAAAGLNRRVARGHK